MSVKMRSNQEMIINEVKAVSKHGSTLWASQVKYVVLDLDGYKGEIKDLKNMISVWENKVKTDDKINLNQNSSYRSNKSVIIKAISLGNQLINPDGSVRGKTEMEKENAAEATVKTPFQQLQTACNTVQAKLKAMQEDPTCTGVDIATAYQLVQACFKLADDIAKNRLQNAA